MRRMVVCSGCNKTKPHHAKGMCSYCYNRSLHGGVGYAIHRKRVYREKVFLLLGGVCRCCSETESAFLEIDHVEGGGGAHHRALAGNTYRYYQSILKDPDARSKYRLLCGNCHNAMHALGVCPHKKRTVFQVLGDKAVLPHRMHPGDAGWDLTVVDEYIINPGCIVDLSTQIAVRMPTGVWAEIIGRSSTVRKWGLDVITGVIDNGYTGELYIGVRNFGKDPIHVPAGSRLAQLIFHSLVDMEWVEVDALPSTDRGEAGFGSTG